MKPATVVDIVVAIVVVPHSRWISDKTNRDQVRPPTRLLHLPIIIVSAALRARSSVIGVLPVNRLVEVLAKVVVGRCMVLRQQWLDVVVIIWKISKMLLKLIERSLVVRKEVWLVWLVHEGLDGLLLPLSVPHVRIEIPMIVEIHFTSFTVHFAFNSTNSRFRNPDPLCVRVLRFSVMVFFQMSAF